MFCWVSLVLISLVQHSPAFPVSQEPPVSCRGWFSGSVDHLNTIQHSESESRAVDMSTGDLVPTHYPARRAAQVALHYINTHYGSPFRVFGLKEVHRARAEDVASEGRKYDLDFSVTDWASGGSVLRCSAQVLFSRSEQHNLPEVQCHCEGLQQLNTSSDEEDFYHKHNTPDHHVSAQDIPDSYGNMSQEMKPFWHLAHVAASFIMLQESNENTEYNMAQVASVIQQESKDNQLMLKYHVLLHDLPSQEIIHWKLLASWSPDGGVRVLETEWQPKCPHNANLPNSTVPTTNSTAN
ncbi:latexin-like [Myxocyprinus asiaticus]|uniref:latexin-like n=1 Tax=Myxocyprinus asiaticus TaxID=70543 RepID=UPI002222587C|nr:latexin-like [Myxocyprinus asiaticus]